jgi:hypothetical protein
MSSSPAEHLDRSLDDARELAERLCGRAPASLEICRGGGNNRVYRVTAGDSVFALKCYGPIESDRDRLSQEFEALNFLSEAGIAGSIPAPIAIDREKRTALYEWIDGCKPSEHGIDDIDAALAFLGQLHRVRHLPTAAALPPATEAVLEPLDLLGQLQRRLTRLASVETERPLAEFLRTELEPELARRAARLAELTDGERLAVSARTLSPSDFGFHNTIRRPDGSLVFIDFEYFGWDDPVKLVADFLWHPAMHLSQAERARFFDGATALFAGEPGFRRRLQLTFPLYGIRWALIMLNEFVPALHARRTFSGKGGSLTIVKTEQLAKARAALDAVRSFREAIIA